MRCIWLGSWTLILGCGAFLLSAEAVRAAESPEGELKKYIGMVHTEKGEEEQIFDLSRPAEAQKLTHLLAAGEVEELKKAKEVNILAISWDLGLWTVVVFVLLLVVLRKLAWKPMLEGLHRRETNIKQALTEAQLAREEAKRMQVQLQAQMDEAQGKVRAILDEARRNAQQSTDEMVARARSEIQTERDRLHREIELAKDQALQQLWTQSAQLATLISAKAIRRQINADDHRRLVDEAIGEIRQRGGEGQRSLAGM